MTDGQVTQKESLDPKGGQTRSEAQNPSVKTYTQDEVDKLLSERHRGLNKQIDSLTKERDTLKTEVTKRESEIQEHSTKIKALESDIDELNESSPDSAEMTKLKRQLRNEVAEREKAIKDKESALKAERETHEKEWEEKSERLKKMELEEFSITAWDVADLYTGGDAIKLKTLCERAGNLTEDFAKQIAETLWTKKSETRKPLVEGTPDAGGTQGSGNSWESIRDAYIKTPNDPRVHAAYMKARRDRGY
jgi:hypothetical protein